MSDVMWTRPDLLNKFHQFMEDVYGQLLYLHVQVLQVT